ncbi:MAG: helix-turn-helix domain-containing protein [Saprospiraceae bacterium]|nr:helix-turn-helix domain-containing protein [Saprospiraceae bacterium]MDZ4705263.1 helix-turn-helix domain-containing protein [Saprospiraceae bacterium]
MAIGIFIKLNEKLFLRDPQETKLGHRIIQESIILIDQIGFEAFTFKKLAERIHSTEASIYRYFENKHLLLLYLLSWYWEWMRYCIEVNVQNVADPRHRLKIAISTIIEASRRNPAIEFVDEDILHRIVISEAIKAYHTKQIDEENKRGFFLTYKALSKVIAQLIRDISPGFPYPKALASTLLEMSNDHPYFALHLPSLTDVQVPDGDLSQVEQLLTDFAFALIDNIGKQKT